MIKIKLFVFLLTGLVLTALQSAGQGQRVSGNVTSAEDGSTLPGVNVLVKGSSTGTITDINGDYSLVVPDNNATLVFSYIGYTSQDIVVGSRTNIDLVMSPDFRQLSEVIVVGYGTQIKAELTGSIAGIQGEEIENIPVPTLEQALQGRAAGVHIASNSGKVGQGIRIRIRGSSSVTASNQPLFVVDGLPITSDNQGATNNEPTNPLADLNFNDVESVQILKDASAAAIYGSRASNGVVLITTKKGKAGATRFNLGYFTGFSKRSNTVGFLNRDEYIELFSEALINAGEPDPTEPGGEFDNNWPLWREGADTNWEEEAFRTGSVRQVDLSASGGTDKTTFYVGGSVSDQEGILIGNEFERISGRVNLDHKATDKLTFGINFSLARTQNSRVANDNAFVTPVQLVALIPFNPKIDPTTNELNTNTLYFNGLIQNRDGQDETIVYRTLGNTYASYEFFPGLTFRSEFGLDQLNQREDSFDGRNTLNGGPAGAASSRLVNVVNYTTNNFFTYNKEVAPDHNLEVTLGTSFQKSTTSIALVEGKGFPNDDFKKIASAAEITNGSSSEEQFSYLSYFARANYKFNNRYLFAISGRIDGSSRFGKDERYGFFPAVSAGWILSEEAFLSGISTVSFLKLRTSYGLTGNSEIENFDALGLYEGDSYDGSSGIRPLSVPSPKLKWETTAQFDIGVDFGLFDDRITGEIDYYIKNTDDLLLNVNVPRTSGFNSITKNIGELENKGIELLINTQNLIGDLRWSTSFNIARNRNKVTNLDGQVIEDGVNRAVEGRPIGVFFMRKYAGVDQANGDALYFLREGSNETTNDPNVAERQVVGNPNPAFSGGITNNFSYKGFDLNILFQFVTDYDAFNAGGVFQAVNADFFDNQRKDQLRRWRNPGDITDIPRAEFGSGNGAAESSRWVEDASYVRLKTMTFGYNFPASVIQRIKASSLRLYVTGQNLLTFTDYSGWDPEVNAQGTGPTNQRANIRAGRDFYTAPQPRSLIFGVKLGF